jgi:hypothetical protein
VEARCYLELWIQFFRYIVIHSIHHHSS